jgi:hypothetical protein
MNDREVATLIWLGIALACGMLSADIRSSLWHVVRAFIQPAILGPLAAFAAWTVGLVAAADAVGVWERDLRSDTMVWFVTVGLTLFFSLARLRAASSARWLGARSRPQCSWKRSST